MKAKSTIHKQIRRLRRLVDSPADVPQPIRDCAYEAYHALRWAIEDVRWTPGRLLEDWAKEDHVRRYAAAAQEAPQ